jgi:acyl-CoA synthetase (AMP-forming)/AMP-acid ligase II
VLKPAASATSDDLIAFLRGQLAGYKVPESVEFLDALPVSTAGKTLK